MSAGTFAILGYVVLQLAIGFYASRGIKNESDYLLAGRSLGPGLVFFSVFATWFGAETCVGAAGEAFGGGLSAVRADPFGYAICLFLMALFLAVPLWKRGITTLGDLFRERFGQRAERVAVLVMIPSSVMWAGAQIRAFGQVLSASASDGTSVLVMTTIAAVVVIAYTAIGGMLADAVTDLVQGIVLAFGLIALVAMAAWSGELGLLAQVDAAHLALATPEESALDIAEAWAVPIFGSLVAQELISRVISARSPSVARNASLAAAPMYLMLGIIPVVMGLLGSVTLPGLEEPEQVLSHTAARYFGPVLMVVFQGALVSAILSTVNSALLVSGSLLAHNMIVPLRPSLSDKQKLALNRLAVVGFGFIAYGLALSAESIYSLVESASAFGSAGVLVCTLLGLFTRFGGEASGLAALLTGVAAYAIGEHALGLPHPFLISIACALGAYGAFAVVKPAEAIEAPGE